VRNLGPQDWLVIGYFAYLNLALLGAEGPGVARQVLSMGLMLVATTTVIVLVRTATFTHGFWAPLLYRLSLQGAVQYSYFLLASYLPVVNPGNLDTKLHAFDLDFFGFEASLGLERHISGPASEWFAFFYFCYFFLLLAHSIPIVIGSRDQRLVSEFSIGILVLFCIGQIVYSLVPGFGPVRALAAQFSSSFPHGLWVDTVMLTVASGGAQKDIFPSLHTAAPVFLTLFSFRNRRVLPFGYTWPIMAFFAANIMIATLFLRWHWVIDVVAGLVLAWFGWWLGVTLTRIETRRRTRLGLPEAWPAFTWARQRQSEMSFAVNDAGRQESALDRPRVQ
jgi:membrane-associated phospholipid phosphatase